jgi:hypothetical protein
LSLHLCENELLLYVAAGPGSARRLGRRPPRRRPRESLAETSGQEALAAWHQIYTGLSAEDQAAVEALALDRSRFSRNQAEWPPQSPPPSKKNAIGFP